jgi:hypothetical protein
MMKIDLPDAVKHQIDWRSDTSFAHAREVFLDYGKIDTVVRWCKSECGQDWRWQIVDTSSDVRPGRYIFYFDSERDCCAFALKWG